jgi:25S rRNA (uracil2634-N3)-methyltransferase
MLTPAGAGITDQDRNILTNQHLLLRTLRSVAAVLTTGPLIDPTNHNSKKRGHNNKPAMRGKANNKPKKEKASDNPELDLESDIEDEEFGDEIEMVDQLVGASTKYTTGAEHVFTPPHRQGSILITLLNQDPYTSWGLPSLAQRPPPSCPGTRLPQPRYRLLRSFKFHHEQYEGYAHRRTIGFKEGKSKADNEEITGRQGEARTWEFVKAPEREPKDERD